jgi:hypothetical protein
VPDPPAEDAPDEDGISVDLALDGQQGGWQ